jgi:hypothetical protein
MVCCGAQCGAKMIMEKDAEAVPGAETRRISLVGTSACIEAGKALISAKVEEHRLRKLGQWVSEQPSLLCLPLQRSLPRSLPLSLPHKLTKPWLSTLFLLRLQNPQPQVQTYPQASTMMMMMPGGYGQMMPQQPMMAATTMYQQPYAAYAQQPVAPVAAANPATDPNHPYAAQWAAYYAAQAQAQTQGATSAPLTAPAAGNFIPPLPPRRPPFLASAHRFALR